MGLFIVFNCDKNLQKKNAVVSALYLALLGFGELYMLMLQG